MNGKAAQLERWLMAIRQRALTNSLGQVTCKSEYHWLLDIPGTNCTRCKAAV